MKLYRVLPAGHSARKHQRAGPTVLTAAVAVLAWLACGSDAFGHMLYVFAQVEGKTIRGEVYFRGRVPARGAKVEVLDPQGGKLGQATTDEKGAFTYTVRFRCDHRLVADTGGGHAAAYLVEAAELPDDLPPRPGGPGAAASHQHRAAAPDSPRASPNTPDDARLKEIIEAAVGRQIAPLRRELQRREDRLRITDLLGGIGYIVGITGLLFYFMAVRRQARGDKQ